MKCFFFILFFAWCNVLAAQGQWLRQALPVPAGTYFGSSTPNNIAAVNENVVWVNAGKHIYRTTDGGNTWANVTPAINDPQFLLTQINSIHATSPNTAYFLAEFYRTHSYVNRIYKTTDGGLTWVHQVQVYPDQITYGVSRACLIHFFDPDHGVTVADRANATGYFEIYTTSNGGSTWTLVPAGNLPAPDMLLDYAGIGHKFAAAGNAIWVCVKGNRILRSTDKGVTWTISHTGLPANVPITAIAFEDLQNGLVSAGPVLKRTSDGGKTWQTVAYTGFFAGSELEAIPGNNGVYISAGKSGSSFSMDHGLSWTSVENTLKHHDIEFVNNGAGFSLADSIVYKFSSNAIETANAKTKPVIDFLISPNPGSGNITISGNSLEPFTVEVYNMAGKQVLQTKDAAFIPARIDLSGQRKGIYYFRILSNGHQALTRKLVLQ
ncbi:T9SS type A sorting domain-containing protein [Adhaeribacter sp. BT258]|uniref:T9SS type A sorting domain-containing protein n=1 Tax=Adhaeribacter terrigena TaxID=2793070 RepID=A0ABS1C2K1_9BACT|nr:T9SS type A sorting domain-containing protein [Adhaeribacter terrigena]MBK0403632.1 T9SS type A sorting domain-containing protein [Adhaeribacter terrigena]